MELKAVKLSGQACLTLYLQWRKSRFSIFMLINHDQWSMYSQTKVYSVKCAKSFKTIRILSNIISWHVMTC